MSVIPTAADVTELTFEDDDSAFVDGSLLYVKKSSKTKSTELATSYSSTATEYNTEIDFISNKLDLDSDEIRKLVVLFSKKIQNCPTHNNNTVQLFTSDNNTWSSSSNDLTTYFISMIFKQQIRFYTASLSIIKFENNIPLKAKISANGYNIIDNLIRDIEFLNQLQHKLLVSSNIDLLISNNLISLLFEMLNYFVHIILHSEKGFQINSILKWFNLMEKTDFLTSFSIISINSSYEIKESIKALSTIISLLFLDLDYNFGSLDDNSTFMSDPSNLNDITNSLLKTPTNSIVLYAWSIILHRQHIVLEMNKEDKKAVEYERKLFQNNSIQNIELMYLSFVNEATKLNFCKSLINVNNLIIYDPILPNILGSFVIAFIPYIEPTDDIIDSISCILRNCSNDVILKFFDNTFTNELLMLLKAKMPLSLNSYLKLISINSNLAVEELRLLPSFMTHVNSKELSSKYAIDDQQPELIKLLYDMKIKLPFEPNDEISLLMKMNTKAQILSTSKEKDETLIMFLYEYNGWSLLGRLLKNLSTRLSVDDFTKKNSRSVIIEFLNYVLLSLDHEVIDLVLNSMNSFVEGQDIIDVLFRIFDQCLQSKDPETLASLITLFDTLSIKGYSNRIWSFIYKSNLLNFKPNGGLVFDILDKVEITSGSYSFIICLLKLGNTLSSLSLNIDDKININLKAQVIDYFTILSIRTFENFSSWKYQLDHEKYEIGITILRYLSKIIEVNANIVNGSTNDIFKVYQSSYKKIVSLFLISDLDELRSVYPLLLMIDEVKNPNIKFTSSSKSGLMFQTWVDESFEFSTKLIKLRKFVDQSQPSNFEKELFRNLINFVNIYLFDDDLRIPILKLLTNLVCADFNDSVPSMLTHLRETHSIILLNCIYQGLSSKHSNSELKISLLTFFTSIMEKNQKGLSLFLITGKSVPNSQPSRDVKVGKFSLFKLLKNIIVDTKNDINIYSYYLLNTMALCISIWHGPISDSEDLSFVRVLLDIISKNINDSTKELKNWDIEIISKAVEIISLFLFVSRGSCKESEKEIFALLNSQTFIETLSLKFRINQKDDHQLKKILDSFNQLTNGNFKLNQFLTLNNVNHDEINTEFYDFRVLDLIFKSDDETWKSIKMQLKVVNHDYQIIESQIHLAKSYGGLITCLCNINPNELSVTYEKLIAELLTINYEEGIPDHLHDQIYRGRIELSFLIILTLSQSKKTISDSMLICIIKPCLELLQSNEVNLIQDLTSLKVDYYKPLLRILLISISMIKTSTFITRYSSTIIELFKNIICKSINILFNSIRKHALSVPASEFGDSKLISKQTDDILIILSLTQEFFKLELNEDLESNIANILIQSGAYRAIAHMFSSSHLINIKGDEIFIDYSIAFIYEFVQTKFVAAKLLENGIFHLLTESPVGLMIKGGHITSYSNHTTVVRLHKLWVERILPIALIMISHFGDNILLVICQFALTFKEQFKYAIQAWLETDSLLSALIIEETGQIIMLAKLLNSMDAYNFVSQELGKPLNEVKLIPGLDSPQERKIFIDALSYLLSHPKYLAMKITTVEGGLTVAQLTEELKVLKESLLM